MEVLQAWRQGTRRAAGAAALAPAAIVAAAAVIALAGGGLGGLGSLGQLVSGPALRDSSTRSSSGQGAGVRTTAVRVPLLAALPASPETGGGASGGSIGGGSTGGGTGPASRPGTEGGGPSTGISGGGAGGGNSPGGGATPAPPGAPSAPLTQMGNVVKGITAPVPEPVSSTADQVVDRATGAAGRALGAR